MIKILHLNRYSFSFWNNSPHGLAYKTVSESKSCSRSLCMRYTFWHCDNLVFEILLWYSEIYHKVIQVYLWTGLFWSHFSSLHSSLFYSICSPPSCFWFLFESPDGKIRYQTWHRKEWNILLHWISKRKWKCEEWFNKIYFSWTNNVKSAGKTKLPNFIWKKKINDYIMTRECMLLLVLGFFSKCRKLRFCKNKKFSVLVLAQTEHKVNNTSNTNRKTVNIIFYHSVYHHQWLFLWRTVCLNGRRTICDYFPFLSPLKTGLILEF